jgi:lipopolysaccharide/colanic/teichoic acid biosynthesis glycosyltransferase
VYKNHVKRFLDVIFSLILLPFAFLIIGICGLFIIIEDGGPIFYIGQRLGKDGRIFRMYKLRSMKTGAPDIRNDDGSTYNAVDDPRLTKVGKFLRKTSLDELPQLMNVLIGDMSFIGPRPDLPEQIRYYESDERRKLEVLPGITGYNQAYFRSSIPWKDRIKNDLYYIDHISLRLDMVIIFKTISGILRQKNIYISNDTKKTYDRSDELVTQVHVKG